MAGIEVKIIPSSRGTCSTFIYARRDEIQFCYSGPAIEVPNAFIQSIQFYCAAPEVLLPLADEIYRACGLVDHRMDATATCKGCKIVFKSAESLDEYGVCEACAEVKP